MRPCRSDSDRLRGTFGHRETSRVCKREHDTAGQDSIVAPHTNNHVAGMAARGRIQLGVRGLPPTLSFLGRAAAVWPIFDRRRPDCDITIAVADADGKPRVTVQLEGK